MTWLATVAHLSCALQPRRVGSCSCVRPRLCRGKLLNVRDASVTQINGNAEINAIKQILGLQHGKASPHSRPGMQQEGYLSCSCKRTCLADMRLRSSCAREGALHDYYPAQADVFFIGWWVRQYDCERAFAQVYDSTKQLRYGHLMIMTDQDHDGSHIKGLIMNFLHHFYPSLLKVDSFLLEFITPIVKVQNGLTASLLPSLWSPCHITRAGVVFPSCGPAPESHGKSGTIDRWI